MQRRDFIKSATAGSLAGLAGTMLAPQVSAAATAAAGVSSEAETALSELQQTLDGLEQAFTTPVWNLRTPQDFAEARRVTLHSLLHALEAWLEADPARPFFTGFIHQHKKLLGDNPDSRYFSAVINDQHSYRIRGNLADATYTSFTIELSAGVEGESQRVGIGATMNDTEFTADENGNYEIILSPEKVEGNWMPLTKGAASITTRHYYDRVQNINNDRLHHIPLDIENLEQQPPRPAPTDSDIAEGIRRVNSFMKGNVIPMNTQTDLPWVSKVPNTFNPLIKDDTNEGVSYAAKDNVYTMAPFVLMPNQALVIRGKFPKCRFANVVLFNRFLQTLDYETRTTSLNLAQTETAEDGSFEMIVAHRDPGRPNWLDTEGRSYGIIFWRFLLPEGDIHPLETEVVELQQA